MLGDFQCVYAAEPEPANYTCLVQNIMANGLTGFILPDRVAIGLASGRVAMELSPSIGAHRLVDGREVSAGPAPPGHVIVRSLTLDSWIDYLALDRSLIAFIKCDVQGWESNVLAGAPRTLQHRHIAWQLEVSPNTCGMPVRRCTTSAGWCSSNSTVHRPRGPGATEPLDVRPADNARLPFQAPPIHGHPGLQHLKE